MKTQTQNDSGNAQLKKVVITYLNSATRYFSSNETLAITNFRLAYSIILNNRLNFESYEVTRIMSSALKFCGLLQNHNDARYLSMTSGNTTDGLTKQLAHIEKNHKLDSLEISIDDLLIPNTIRHDILCAWDFMANHCKTNDEHKKTVICYQIIYSHAQQLSLYDRENGAIKTKAMRDLGIALYHLGRASRSNRDATICYRHAIDLFEALVAQNQQMADERFLFAAQQELVTNLINRSRRILKTKDSHTNHAGAIILFNKAIAANNKMNIEHPEFLTHQKLLLGLLEQFVTALMEKASLADKRLLLKTLLNEYMRINANLSIEEQDKLIQVRRQLIFQQKSFIADLFRISSCDAIQQAFANINEMLQELRSIPLDKKSDRDFIDYSLGLKQYALAKVILVTVYFEANPATAIDEIYHAIHLNNQDCILSNAPEHFPELPKTEERTFFEIQRKIAGNLVFFANSIKSNFTLLEATSFFYISCIQAIEKIPERSRELFDNNTLISYINNFLTTLSAAYAVLPFNDYQQNLKALKVLQISAALLNKFSEANLTLMHKNQKAFVESELHKRELIQEQFENDNPLTPVIISSYPVLAPLVSFNALSPLPLPFFSRRLQAVDMRSVAQPVAVRFT